MPIINLFLKLLFQKLLLASSGNIEFWYTIILEACIFGIFNRSPIFMVACIEHFLTIMIILIRVFLTFDNDHRLDHRICLMSISSISASVYRIKRASRVTESTNKQTKCQSRSYKIKVKVAKLCRKN